MPGVRTLVLLLGPMLLASGCVATTTSSTTWGPAYAEPAWVRPGRVDFVRETVRRHQGNPAAGAVAGAVVGGLLGHAFFGHGSGAFFGAATGAAVGANASQGYAEERFYEVFVRFDDGEGQVFLFRGAPPFRPGDPVVLTPQGLALAAPR